MSISNVKKVKNENKINLFNRLSGKYNQSILITGLDNKKVSLIGAIDSVWSEKIKNGEDVKLFVSWGRGDFQKNMDSAIKSFLKFAKPEKGKNSVMVLGGELAEGNSETAIIKQL